jgi:type II secretory pathway pseudopilin PulG
MKRDRGFAMLFVLLMAGLIAITLYMALPRAAFEAQREKEQSLIDRGSQYKRAVQLYVRQNKRWPAKIEDLENTNGKRYLRKRYVDPMTGKDEWRPVHVGPNGVLTDSLVKPLKKDKDSTYSNNFITELGGVGEAPTGTTGPGNPGLRKRPSDTSAGDVGQIGSGSLPPGPGQIVAGGPLPGLGFPSYTPQPGQGLGQGNYPPGLHLPNGAQTGAGGLPPQLQGAGPGTLNGNPNPPSSAQIYGGITVLGGVGGGGYSTAPGANGVVQPPMQGQLQGQNTGLAPGQTGTGNPTPPNAAQLIQGILTSPRPGGAPGTPIGTGAGQVQGGGIAGFASKFEGDAIKVYNDQTEYQKWEFVYDMSKDKAITGPQQAIPQVPGPNTPGGFGNTSSTGNSGFGSGNGAGVTVPTPTTPPVVH